MNGRQRQTIVIGGGLAGVTVLFELVSRGIEAVLLETADELGAGASHANGGILSTTRPEPWNGPGVFRHLASSLLDPRSPMKLRLRALPALGFWGLDFIRHSTPERHRRATVANRRLAALSMAVLETLRESPGLDFDAAGRGCLDLFPDEALLEENVEFIEGLHEESVRTEVLDRDGVLAVEPQLEAGRENFAGGLFYPDDGVGDARKFVVGLAGAAAARGAEIRTATRAERIIVEDGRVAGVVAGGEMIEGAVVVAAGIDAPALTHPHGLELPIRPAKGYSLTIDARVLGADMPSVPVIDEKMHAGISPLGDRLRLVGTAEFTGRDTRIRPERIDNLFTLLERLYPDHARRIDRETAVPWAGLRPMTADGMPIVGPGGIDGLWLSCGHGPLGWTLGPGSARLLADLIEGREPAIDPAPYTPLR